jgi:hypothetical protein
VGWKSWQKHKDGGAMLHGNAAEIKRRVQGAKGTLPAEGIGPRALPCAKSNFFRRVSISFGLHKPLHVTIMTTIPINKSEIPIDDPQRKVLNTFPTGPVCTFHLISA